jgi:hypothetical protein
MLLLNYSGKAYFPYRWISIPKPVGVPRNRSSQDIPIRMSDIRWVGGLVPTPPNNRHLKIQPKSFPLQEADLKRCNFWLYRDDLKKMYTYHGLSYSRQSSQAQKPRIDPFGYDSAKQMNRRSKAHRSYFPRSCAITAKAAAESTATFKRSVNPGKQ